MNKKVSYGGLGAALILLFILLATYLPTGRAALVFCASLVVFVVSFLKGVRTAAVMYGATAFLIVLFCIWRSPAMGLSYVICFGNYPLFKIILQNKPKTVKITAKSALYAAYFFAAVLVVKNIIVVEIAYPTALLFAIGVVCFALYDYLLAYSGIFIAEKLH